MYDDDEDELAVNRRGGPRQYDADRGIRRSSYYSGLSGGQIDELIIKLHNARWSQSQIARYLRERGAQPATQQGISLALRRIAAGRVGAGPRPN
jgi:hypothetical protein